MATPEQILAGAKIIDVDLSKLQIDSSYQRDLSEALVDEIAENPDGVAAELPTISDRGIRNGGDVKGGLWIVNGQHRAKGFQKAGLKKFRAQVIDMRKEENPAAIEATLRLRTNRKLGDRPLERFKAQLTAENEESLAIVKILAEFDATINVASNSEAGVNCVSTIEALYRMDDGSLLGDTLKLVKDTYGHVGGQTANSSLLKGLCWFIDKHHEESDRDRLVVKLKGLGKNTLEGRARTMGLTMGGAMWVNYYRAIVDLYNEQLREKNRLQFKTRGKSKLYTGGGTNRAA